MKMREREKEKLTTKKTKKRNNLTSGRQVGSCGLGKSSLLARSPSSSLLERVDQLVWQCHTIDFVFARLICLI